MEVFVKQKAFRIREVRLKQHGSIYRTFELFGHLGGRQIRRRFKSYSRALAEKNILEVDAANADGAIRTVSTRLTAAQLAEAEAVITRLAGRKHTLMEVVDWFIANYRAPVVSELIETAAGAFTADRRGFVSHAAEKDYRMVMGMLIKAFPKRAVASVTTAELEALLATRGKARKTWNNLRLYLHAFFEFCADSRRRWVAVNPAKAIKRHAIARGLPEILAPTQVQALFEYLESYAGPSRCGYRPGYLVPYFALATFAGIRPSVKNGELFELHRTADKSRIIDEALSVIRLPPELTKTNGLRQIAIQPNLAAWLKRYPLKDWPLMVPNMEDHVSRVRKHFKLPNDVLRHTFCSMHVAKFQSLGATALEAGNSESVIKKHYLNLVSIADAEAFWSISPKC